eukprot:TRINITY_DN15569_c0_g1_i1.p1 TRINITY_DN15569_c0_g1~~TRINITY_DN15569_c0_g1_i1.p1  ORF type:complete len:150 (+),score=31.42 TRINITY_DN15569_c0_g1_i1:145-594(+)
MAPDLSDAEAKELESHIAVLHGVVCEDKFQKAREDFMARNCQHFSVEDENKLCYTDIHTEFLKMTECYICEQLTMKGIDIQNLMSALSVDDISDRQLDIGTTLDVVNSLTDFSNFKEMMLRAKHNISGRRKALCEETDVKAEKDCSNPE